MWQAGLSVSANVLPQCTLAQVLTLKETTLSTLMEDDIKRWTAKRKTAPVLDIIQVSLTCA